MSDTQFLLGKLVEGDPERDAVHIAVVAVEAGNDLKPGTRVGFRADGKASSKVPEIIGIVDPFLTALNLPAKARYYPGTLRIEHIAVGAYDAVIWQDAAKPVHPAENIGSLMPSTTARPLGEILGDTENVGS